MKRRELQQIGAMVKDFRKDAGLKQKELAKRCGIHEMVVRRIEQGVAFTNVRTLMAICEALGLSADSLLWEE